MRAGTVFISLQDRAIAMAIENDFSHGRRRENLTVQRRGATFGKRAEGKGRGALRRVWPADLRKGGGAGRGIGRLGKASSAGISAGRQFHRERRAGAGVSTSPSEFTAAGAGSVRQNQTQLRAHHFPPGQPGAEAESVMGGYAAISILQSSGLSTGGYVHT